MAQVDIERGRHDARERRPYDSRRSYDVRDYKAGYLEGIKRDSPDCPECDGLMVIRIGRNGQFWGCADYPECKGTEQY